MENIRVTPVRQISSGQASTEDTVISADEIMQRVLNDQGNRQGQHGKTKDLAGNDEKNVEASAQMIFMNMQPVLPQNVLAVLTGQRQDKTIETVDKFATSPQRHDNGQTLPVVGDFNMEMLKTTLSLSLDDEVINLPAEAHILPNNTVVPAVLQPQSTDNVIYTSAGESPLPRSNERGMMHPTQYLSAASTSANQAVNQDVTEIRWTFPTQQSARVQIEHAQNRADTVVQVVPSDIEIGQRLANFQQLHPLQVLRMDITPAQNDNLHSQQNSQQQQQQNQAERDASSEEEEA